MQANQIAQINDMEASLAERDAWTDYEMSFLDDRDACPVCDGLHGLAGGCPLENTGTCSLGIPQMAPDGSGCLCGCC